MHTHVVHCTFAKSNHGRWIAPGKHLVASLWLLHIHRKIGPWHLEIIIHFDSCAVSKDGDETSEQTTTLRELDNWITRRFLAQNCFASLDGWPAMKPMQLLLNMQTKIILCLLLLLSPEFNHYPWRPTYCKLIYIKHFMVVVKVVSRSEAPYKTHNPSNHPKLIQGIMQVHLW